MINKNKQIKLFKGLYKGLTANLIISAPSAGFYFLGYETTKEFIKATQLPLTVK